MNMFYQVTLTILVITILLILILYFLLDRENGDLTKYQGSSDYKFAQLTHGLTAYKEFNQIKNHIESLDRLVLELRNHLLNTELKDGKSFLRSFVCEILDK